ncbi:MAG: hypothetical protein QOI76_1305 [Frankiales bacterium]|nr:hypothetical protein [Frankiales bacterium]
MSATDETPPNKISDPIDSLATIRGTAVRHLQNSAFFSTSCFLVHTSNTSHQQGCCNDRLSSPSPFGAILRG